MKYSLCAQNSIGNHCQAVIRANHTSFPQDSVLYVIKDNTLFAGTTIPEEKNAQQGMIEFRPFRDVTQIESEHIQCITIGLRPSSPIHYELVSKQRAMKRIYAEIVERDQSLNSE